MDYSVMSLVCTFYCNNNTTRHILQSPCNSMLYIFVMLYIGVSNNHINYLPLLSCKQYSRITKNIISHALCVPNYIDAALRSKLLFTHSIMPHPRATTFANGNTSHISDLSILINSIKICQLYYVSTLLCYQKYNSINCDTIVNCSSS